MKLSGNRMIESIVTQRAKHMITSIEGEIPLVKFTKSPQEATFALITTSGVHLKSQPIFNVEEGDSTVRFIPKSCSETDLMISHTHFDREDADQDINCVFPLSRLKELANEGKIGKVANTHYGLMGYIPNTDLLMNETIPLIIKQLKTENVDAVILNPGCYICHQTTGLLQYEIEKSGISTISVIHLKSLIEKIRVPRALHLRFPLGRSFGRAFEVELQKDILLDAIKYLTEINEPETMIKLPYKWRRRRK